MGQQEAYSESAINFYAFCILYYVTKSVTQAYITGNAFVILTGADTILQTIYDDDETQLEAIALDENSGKIATCAGSNIRIYKPYGQDEGALKVSITQPQLAFWNAVLITFSGLCNIAFQSTRAGTISQIHYHGEYQKNCWWGAHGLLCSQQSMRRL